MNHTKQKKKILELLKSFEELFSIQNYTRVVDFYSEEHPENEMIAAQIVFSEDYSHVRIKIYPLFFEETPEVQRKVILHELCHTITLPSKRISNDLHEGKLITPQEIQFVNERATSQIENLLDKFLTGKLQYAQDAYKKYIRK